MRATRLRSTGLCAAVSWRFGELRGAIRSVGMGLIRCGDVQATTGIYLSPSGEVDASPRASGEGARIISMRAPSPAPLARPLPKGEVIWR